MTILMDIPENSMFLYGAPNEGWTPELVASWLSAHPSAQAYVDMYAQVWNLQGSLMHDLEEDVCSQEGYCEWDDFLTRLSGRMIALQQSLGLAPEGSGLPLAKALAPIMNAHGYRCESGWWVSAREDDGAFGGKPPSWYVTFESYAEKVSEIERMLANLDVTAHTHKDEGYSHLCEGDIALDVKGPHHDCDIWIELAEEATLGMAGWHTHYDNYEFDYQLFEHDLKRLTSGEACVITFFLGEQWIGSLMRDTAPETDGVARSILEAEFLEGSSEWRELAKTSGYLIKIRSWIAERNRDISLS